MSKITSFETACDVLGYSHNLPQVAHLPESVQKGILADYKWTVIVEALNNEGQPEKWVADYDNDDQYKYELRVYKSPSSGWSLVGVGDWFSVTDCGARRVFRTREIGRYAGENLLEHFIATF